MISPKKTNGDPPGLSPQLRRVEHVLRSSTGISFQSGNWTALRDAVQARRRALSGLGMAEYVDLLSSSAAEMDELISLVTVDETYFMRERRHFTALAGKVLPSILRRHAEAGSAHPTIRLVSCGCATGEEPYSLALTLLLSGLLNRARFQILALDIDASVLEKARTATYTRNSFRQPDSDGLLAPFFSHHGGLAQLSPRVRRMVTFEKANLLDSDSIVSHVLGADVIFLRNVLIYFDEYAIRRVFRNLARVMSPSGYLFLGSTELARWKASGMTLVDLGGVRVLRPRPPGSHHPAKPSRSNSTACAPRQACARPAIHHGPSTPRVSRALPTPGPGQPVRPTPAPPPPHQAGKQHGDQVAGLLAQARAQADTGEDQLALSICDEILRLDNLNTEAYLTRALIAFKAGRYRDSLKELRRVLYCDKAHFVGRLYMALCYREMGMDSRADAEMTAAVKLARKAQATNPGCEINGIPATYVLGLQGKGPAAKEDPL